MQSISEVVRLSGFWKDAHEGPRPAETALQLRVDSCVKKSRLTSDAGFMIMKISAACY